MQSPWKDIVPYTKEEAARFKGRDEDIRKFSRILLYSDFSVLYADSGMLLWRIDGDVMDIETAKSIGANRELTFVTREKDIKRVRLLSLKEMIEMRRRQLNTSK